MHSVLTGRLLQRGFAFPLRPHLLRSQAKWMAPGLGLSLNYLQSMGDIWIPTVTSWIPGLLLGSFFDDQWLPVVAWFIFALEYFLSTIAIARCMDSDRVIAAA